MVNCGNALGMHSLVRGVNFPERCDTMHGVACFSGARPSSKKFPTAGKLTRARSAACPVAVRWSMIDAVATPKTALTLAVVCAASEINNQGSRLLLRLLSSQIDKEKNAFWPISADNIMLRAISWDDRYCFDIYLRNIKAIRV
jgi:hypothetical protein